ncbi:MAG: hypothetical protein HYZ53_20420 [Planctomycetes bacterium]|nr:hypothetical protein [Planctomycetota bacterium]
MAIDRTSSPRSSVFAPLLHLTLLAAVLAASPRLAPAQGEAPGIKEVSVAFEADPPSVPSGGAFVVRVRASIAEGFHIYALGKSETVTPTRIAFQGVPALRPEGALSGPTPKKKFDEGFQAEVQYYEGSPAFEQRFQVAAGTPAGELTLEGTFSFQACNETMCYPEAAIPLKLLLRVQAPPAGAGPGPGPAPAIGTGPVPGPGPGGIVQVPVPPAVPEPTVRVRPRADRAEARAGEWVEARFAFAVKKGYHVYSTREIKDGPLPTSIQVKQGQHLTALGGPIEPAPHKEFDEGFKLEVETHAGEFEVAQRFRVAADAPQGPLVLGGQLRYMSCGEGSCVPDKLPFEFTWTVVPGEARAEFRAGEGAAVLPAPPSGSPPAGPGGVKPLASPSGNAPAPAGGAAATGGTDVNSMGLWPFVLLCIGGGFLTLIMPCTYPMIPLTVSFFTKRAEKTGGSVVGLAFVYALGIVVSFTGLGILLTLAFGAQGAQLFASNAWLNLAIGVVFVVFGFSMLGMYELQAPAFLMERVGQARSSGGYAGVFMMGLTFSVAAFACVGPVVGPLLAASAAGEWFRPVLGMALVSSVVGAAFFGLALFPGMVRKMPGGGGWLVRIKTALGFLELAAAFKFLSNADVVLATGILSRDLYLGIWAAIFTALALYLLGLFRMEHDPEEGTVGSVSLVFGMCSLALALYLCAGLFRGASLGELEAFIPPPPAGASEAKAGKGEGTHALTEFDNLPAAEELARSTGRPIFIDFTAFT